MIATGFADRSSQGVGKTVDLKSYARSGERQAWRRRAELRADGQEEPSDDTDLDIPAFLRRQAD